MLGRPLGQLGQYGDRADLWLLLVRCRRCRTDVQEGVVPNSGHWIMEENPKATVALVRAFLDKGR